MASEKQLPRYKVRVEEVLSGDDLILLVDLGVDGLFKKVRARLHGVDTPDAYRKSPDSEAGKVRNAVRAAVSGKNCLAELHSDRKSGWIITLYVEEGSGSGFCLNDRLTSQGYVYNSRLTRDE